MSASILREKAKGFAVHVANVVRELKSERKDGMIANQLLRSATSIGANLHEANYAHGTADFVSKLEIALKECFESEYWLEILFDMHSLDEAEYKSLKSECGLIRKMLISSCNTVKSRK